MKKFRSLILAAMMTASSVAWGAANHFAVTPQEIVTELKGKLELNVQQEKELTTALTGLSNTLNGLIAKQEAAGKEEDPSAFIRGVKKAQVDYQGKLKTILSKAQLNTYHELKEKVIMQAMESLAEIRLLDIQPSVKFSDQQLKKLVPVIAESLKGFVKIAWQYAGERLGVLRRLKVAAELKRIQSKAEEQVQTILTPEQYKKWEAYKQVQQQKRKAS